MSDVEDSPMSEVESEKSLDSEEERRRKHPENFN